MSRILHFEWRRYIFIIPTIPPHASTLRTAKEAGRLKKDKKGQKNGGFVDRAAEIPGKKKIPTECYSPFTMETIWLKKPYDPTAPHGATERARDHLVFDVSPKELIKRPFGPENHVEPLLFH